MAISSIFMVGFVPPTLFPVGFLEIATKVKGGTCV
jgi:hypothetical protein